MSKSVPSRSRMLSARDATMLLLGAFIQAAGVSNIHAFSGVTEGGVLGLTLLMEKWVGISPALSSLALNGLCFLLGLRVLGRPFLFRTAVACGGYAAFYALFEPFAPLCPELTQSPLLSSLVGAVFVGIGAGLCVRYGGAPSGDDALAMALGRLLHTGVQHIYLASDLTVLALALTYIPWQRIGYSLLTVVLSGQIIGLMQKKKNAPRRP